MGKVNEPKSLVKNGGKLKPKQREQIKKNVINKIQKGTLTNYSQIELARQNKISRQAMIKIIGELKEDLEIHRPEAYKVDMVNVYNSIRERLQYWLDYCKNNHVDMRTEVALMKELRETVNGFSRLLTDLGVIEKPTQRLIVEDEIVTELVVNVN